MHMNMQLVEWLLEQGGPAIRYRTSRELLSGSKVIDLVQLQAELIRSPQVRDWLDHLGTSFELNHLHSSKVTAYENAMGKLIQLGCHNGIAHFDRKSQIYRSWLTAQSDPTTLDMTPFKRKVIGSFLIAAGYHHENGIRHYLSHRLGILWRFAHLMDFDIYTDRDQYRDIPKGFHDKPLVKPELYPGGEEFLPSIYDMHALANYPAHLLDADTQERIDSVIAYILNPEYQALPVGYGLMRAGKRKYYAIGWSVHLPGYHPGDEIGSDLNQLVQRLVLMSNFRVAREHPWFQENLRLLESFRTDRGTYIFPRTYLQERTSGYWVTGAYMGLEQNRRKRIAIELESTFWMLKIKKNVALEDRADQ